MRIPTIAIKRNLSTSDVATTTNTDGSIPLATLTNNWIPALDVPPDVVLTLKMGRDVDDPLKGVTGCMSEVATVIGISKDVKAMTLSEENLPNCIAEDLCFEALIGTRKLDKPYFYHAIQKMPEKRSFRSYPSTMACCSRMTY